MGISTVKNKNVSWTDTQTNQGIFDSYNNWIMSADRKVFFKLCMRMNLFNQVKDLHGDIVECGVFKGAGLLSWLKLIDMHQPHSIKKVIGFDFFDPSFTDSLESSMDKENMKHVFNRDPSLKSSELSIESIKLKLNNAGFNDNKFELIKGDISDTAKLFVEDKPGFRISLLYLDLDLDHPTYDTLEAFWDRVVPGGIVVFDEYAIYSWTESNAVDRFFKDKKVKIINTNIFSPSAYIIKE